MYTISIIELILNLAYDLNTNEVCLIITVVVTCHQSMPCKVFSLQNLMYLALEYCY